MNKSEKIICMFLACVLGWWVFDSVRTQRRLEAEAAARPAATVAAAAHPAAAPAAGSAATVPAASVPAAEAPSAPERLVTLSNGCEKVTLTSHGAAIRSVTLLEYREKAGPEGDDNHALELDFGVSPALSEPGKVEAWEVREASGDYALFALGARTRRISLKEGYIIEVEDDAPEAGRVAMSLGAMARGGSKNDILSIDSWDPLEKGGRVRHWGELEPLKGWLAGSLSGGCGSRKTAAGLPATTRVPVVGAQKWVALKNRFFVAAIAESSAPIAGFCASVERDLSAAEFRVKRVSAAVDIDAPSGKRTARLYIGPKKQSALWDLGMRDVMEFGMWRWVCYPMVRVLNIFHGWIPNFGVAIVLLTLLVRIIFWPLTHKSTLGMRKMQEIQPLVKEIQAKYRDNPQRLQQETWALYRERKVNPMSSCLPMLVQIPVFIALFTVLRSAVELRYAPFLWISDLSEPEALFAGWFPFGGLNVLPVLMALTMALQSALTPSSGDPRQQRMMMVMMPAIMLVMFYNFPSALSLYWTLSQVLSIAQMWWIRRRYGPGPAAASGVEVVDAPLTRQMRRHSN